MGEEVNYRVLRCPNESPIFIAPHEGKLTSARRPRETTVRYFFSLVGLRPRLEAPNVSLMSQKCTTS